MKKLNASGFAHQVLILALVVVAVIGGIGSYIYLRKSSAAVSPAAVCGSGYSIVKSSSTGRSILYVLKNAGAKKFCVINLATGTAYGTSKPMLAVGFLQNKTTGIQKNYAQNNGTFKYYAGPVYVSYNGYSSSKWFMGAKGDMYISNFNYRSSINYVSW